MSTGGTVPTQGIVISEATTEKKRGERGPIGKGSPSKRVKAAWRMLGSKLSLKEYARTCSNEDMHDAKEWLASKRPNGSDSFRKMRKEVRSKRQSMRIEGKAKAKLKSSNKKKVDAASVSGRGGW